MKKIGVLSDTHGFLDDKIIKFFDKCDEIWHAGDIGDFEVAQKLMDLKPLRAVYGNIDGMDVRKTFEKHNRFKCEEMNIWITHIGGYPNRYSFEVKPEIFRNPPNIFICGHSHILKIIHDHKIDCLHINPGAAGNYGSHLVKTAVRFDIENKKISNLEIFEISRR